MKRNGWYKSSYSSANSACVEVMHTDGGISIRDTKDNGSGPILRFTAEEWDAFLAGALDGEFDRPVQ